MTVTLVYTKGEERTFDDIKTYRFHDGFIIFIDKSDNPRALVHSGHVKEVIFHRDQLSDSLNV